MNHPFRAALLSVFLLPITGCANLEEYDVTFNERVVYSPRPLAVDEAVTDTALATCISQSLKDSEARIPADLKILNCTQAGISKLDGIEVYGGLEQVKLADNEIRNPEPLASLGKLVFLDLTGNRELTCSLAEALRAPTLSLPEHCGS